MAYSTILSSYYDALMGDYSHLLNSINTLLATYGPRKKHLRILELACGTGSILKTFPTSHELYGLDISKEMIAIAKKKVPHATLRVGDMTTFSYLKKFDVILCVFDSINHLTKFSQWEKVFYLAAQHLDTNGLFIFDMNTTKRLSSLVTRKPYVRRLRKDIIVFEQFSYVKSPIYNLQIAIIKDVGLKNLDVFEENVQEAVFDVKQVKNSLFKHFEIEKMLDPYRKKVSKNTGRIFFACKKIL